MISLIALSVVLLAFFGAYMTYTIPQSPWLLVTMLSVGVILGGLWATLVRILPSKGQVIFASVAWEVVYIVAYSVTPVLLGHRLSLMTIAGIVLATVGIALMSFDL